MRSKMSKSASRERRQQKTRQAILDTALRIIVERGPEELSMRSLAERIDYSPSGLYEYFDSKEEIIQAVCGTGHLRLTQAMRQVDETIPVEDYLVQIGSMYVDFAAANPDLFQLMFTALPAEPPDVNLTSQSSSYPILLGAIQRGIADGTFAVREGFGLQEMAFAAWSMVHGIAMLRIQMSDFAPVFEALKHEALLAITRGLMRR